MKGYTCLALGVATSLATTVVSSAVVTLAIDTFDDFISSHSVVMVEYYAPWCAICQELEPVYETTASLLNMTKDIKFARVDCVSDAALCERYGTPIYPTLRLFQGPEQQTIYNGAREPDDMISYAERRYGTSVRALTNNENVNTLQTSDNVIVIGYWHPDDATSNETFTEVAKSLVDYYTFVATNDFESAQTANVQRPGVVLKIKDEDRELIYDGAFEADGIADFINLKSIPTVGEFNRKWSWRYFGEGTLPFVGIFTDSAASRADVLQTIRPVAQEFRNIFSFATVDATESRHLVAKFDLLEQQLPAVAIRDLEGRIFHTTADAELGEQTIRQWVQDVQDGRIDPHVKSELVSESHITEDLTTLIDDENFDELVLDPEVDVLLEFYAPWCSHCKRLAPVYAQLADMYLKYDSKVRIAKVDASIHKIPGHTVTSFPTIQLFPAQAKGAPITYTGNRTLEDLSDFVQLHSKSMDNAIHSVNTDGHGGKPMVDVDGTNRENEASRDEL